MNTEIAPQETAASVLQAANVEVKNENSITPEVVVENKGVLRIEIIKAQSWITVKGSKSKRSLAEKLYVAGDVLTFDDPEEVYRLTIGAPLYVKVYYNGEEIPMQLNGKVARIKLPQ